ncbi:MAG: hypothetical protein ACE5D3_01565 [Candidatus Binatia bacterium]
MVVVKVKVDAVFSTASSTVPGSYNPGGLMRLVVFVVLDTEGVST